MKTKRTLRFLGFFTLLALFAACGPDDKDPIEPKPKPAPERIKDSTFENRTWQFMGYGDTDSIHLNLPDDAAQHTLILKDSILGGTISNGNYTAKYKLYADKTLSIESLSTEMDRNSYIIALKALKQARKYEVSNEALKIFYSDKQYLLFVEKNGEYPKNLSSQLVYIYPFELKAGRQVIINSQAELEQYMNAQPAPEDFPLAGHWPYTECMYPDYNLLDIDKQTIDFSLYSIVIGSLISVTDVMHTEQNFTRVGINTYLYNIKLFQKYNLEHKINYGILVPKIPSNATIIHNIKLVNENDWHW